MNTDEWHPASEPPKCSFCRGPVYPKQIREGVFLLECMDAECKTTANPISLNEEKKLQQPNLGAYPLALSFKSRQEREQFVSIIEELRAPPK